jgi:hypothetical protein
VGEIAPELAERLKLGERNQRTVRFTLAELKAIKEKAGKALRQIPAAVHVVRQAYEKVSD